MVNCVKCLDFLTLYSLSTRVITGVYHDLGEVIFWTILSTCPTLWGEKIVMQILNPSTIGLDIDRLGFEEEQKRIYLEALTNSSGMILATGPEGSGKTITLYTGLNILNKKNVNIFTVEEPVEINLPGINQVQVDERIGMSFAKVFKVFLRQFPDIILIGEIRDLETASIAIRSASSLSESTAKLLFLTIALTNNQ